MWEKKHKELHRDVQFQKTSTVEQDQAAIIIASWYRRVKLNEKKQEDKE